MTKAEKQCAKSQQQEISFHGKSLRRVSKTGKHNSFSSGFARAAKSRKMAPNYSGPAGLLKSTRKSISTASSSSGHFSPPGILNRLFEVKQSGDRLHGFIDGARSHA